MQYPQEETRLRSEYSRNRDEQQTHFLHLFNLFHATCLEWAFCELICSARWLYYCDAWKSGRVVGSQSWSCKRLSRGSRQYSVLCTPEFQATLLQHTEIDNFMSDNNYVKPISRSIRAWWLLLSLSLSHHIWPKTFNIHPLWRPCHW